MVIENREDVKNIIRMFFELVDAHYGMFFTDHIGEGGSVRSGRGRVD